MMDPTALALAGGRRRAGRRDERAGRRRHLRDTAGALIALGLPANVANATSNVALLPGAAASAWEFRDELAPVAGSTCGQAVGDHLCRRAGRQRAAGDHAVATPSTSSSLAAADRLRGDRVRRRAVGLAAVARHDRAAHADDRPVAARHLWRLFRRRRRADDHRHLWPARPRIRARSSRSARLMLAIANFAAAIVFVASALVRWCSACRCWSGDPGRLARRQDRQEAAARAGADGGPSR
jgi:hypothetical protein